MHLQVTKMYRKKKKKNTQSNMLFNPFATLFLNLQKKYKNIYKKNCHIIEI